MSSYVVRRAFMEDKEDILRIHDNVYSGLDYLPDYFDDFMNNPLIESFVYEEYGDIIGYLASHRVDGGVTAVDRAGRVNPRHIGTGVYRRLLAGVEQINREEGLVQRHALVKIEPPSANFRNVYRHVMTRNIHTYEIDASDEFIEEQFAKEDTRGSLQILGDSLPPNYFQNSLLRYLFPEKRLLIDWVPLRPLQSNLPILKSKNTTFVSDVRTTSIGVHTGLLSASSIYRAHHGVDISCTVDIFGSDCRTLSRHLSSHLNRAISCGQHSVNFTVITNTQLESAKIDNCLRKFGIDRSHDGPRGNPEVYEKYL